VVVAVSLPRPKGVGAERSAFGRLALVAEREAEKPSVITWPSPRWRTDPVGFARDVLGIEVNRPGIPGDSMM
jgi:hypothetical protein